MKLRFRGALLGGEGGHFDLVHQTRQTTIRGLDDARQTPAGGDAAFGGGVQGVLLRFGQIIVKRLVDHEGVG